MERFICFSSSFVTFVRDFVKNIACKYSRISYQIGVFGIGGGGLNLPKGPYLVADLDRGFQIRGGSEPAVTPVLNWYSANFVVYICCTQQKIPVVAT